MKKISECSFDVNKRQDQASSTFTETDYKIINDLFAVFQSIFPAFKQAWPTEREFEMSKREWIKTFKLAELSSLDVIKIGVDKFRLLETPFVPSPGQFIAMCKPEISLVPPMYMALPKPDVCLDKQKSEMDKVREILGARKCPSKPSPN